MKLIGYFLAGLGLIGLGLNSKAGREFSKDIIPFLEKIPENYLMIGSLVIVILGIVIMIITGKGWRIKQEEEVPIYVGEGRKRRIVGYRRHR